MTNLSIFGKLLAILVYNLDFAVSHSSKPKHRILIASANPLFREGLRKLYAADWHEQEISVEMVSTMEETLKTLESNGPDLFIVDHDDKTINRSEFLNRFVTGEVPMKVILVSLAASEPVVIYNRMQLTAAQAEDWLANPWKE